MKNYHLFLLVVFTSISAYSQMSASFVTSLNTQCDGVDCFYSGPSIMINEIMISPTANDGSISGSAAGLPGDQRGEWIELYNPNTCEPVDISCYYLGSSATQTGYVGGQAFQLPSGSIIPPGGFCVVRGINAVPVPTQFLIANGGNTLEIVVPGELTGDGICMEGASPTRFWFPNAGGWFAFYDDNGVAQDALSWGSVSGSTIPPCVPVHSSCTSSSVTSLQNLANIPANRKTVVYSSAVPVTGNSVQRIPDGGPWQINQGSTPTLGDCNGICNNTSSSTCDGQATINITNGSGNYSYLWDDSQGQLTQTAIELCAGTYTVIVTDQTTGDVEIFTIDIEDVVVVAELTVEEELCNYGQTVSFPDIATYTPQPNLNQTGVFSGVGAIGNDFDVSVSGVGTFAITYTFTDENGCTDSIIDNVIVHEAPQAQISNIQPEYCIADSIVEPLLSPLGGLLFGPGISNDQFILEDAGVGSHIIKYAVENQYGCRDTAQITVVIHANPSFSIVVTQPNCDQDDGEIVINTNPGAAPYDYSIDGGVNNQSNNTFSNIFGGFYDILVTDDNGCISKMDTILTDIVSDPSFTFSDFCLGETNEATNIVTPAGEFTFNPPVSDGAMINQLTGSISNGVGGSTYMVQHATTGNCPDTAVVEVTVNAVPEPQFVADTLYGCNPFNVVFTNLNNSVGSTCFWDFGDGNTSTLCDNVLQTYQMSGDYNVSFNVTDANGCVGTETKNNYIKVIQNPVASFYANPMIAEIQDPFITFTNKSYNATSFVWDFGDGSPNANTFNSSHDYPKNEEGDYIVTLIASRVPGCSDTARLVIQVKEELIFYIPNSFTPDGDNFNEIFQPVFSSGFDPQTYTLLIYNRWGELIFESNDTDVGWDGTYGRRNYKLAKGDTYLWQVKIKEKGNDKFNVYSGHVTLMR